MYEDSAGWYDLDYITQDDLDEDSRSNHDNLQDLDEEWYSRRDTQDFYELSLQYYAWISTRMCTYVRTHMISSREPAHTQDLDEPASTHAHILYGSRREHAHVSYVTLEHTSRSRL